MHQVYSLGRRGAFDDEMRAYTCMHDRSVGMGAMITTYNGKGHVYAEEEGKERERKPCATHTHKYCTRRLISFSMW